MTSPAELAAGLRAHAEGLYWLEAAAELLIAKSWLHRDDFTSRFVTLHPGGGIGSGQQVTVIDWPAVIAARPGLKSPLLRGRAADAEDHRQPGRRIPVDLQDTLTGLDDRNVQLLITAIFRASGKSLKG